MNELKVVSDINIEKLSESHQNQLEEILNLFKEMNASIIEPHIDEDLNEDYKNEDGEKLGKYAALAILRDLFLDFKKSNDTAINLEVGKCKTNCYPDCCVFNLSGNISKKNFAFVLDKQDGIIKTLHYCGMFSTKDNVRRIVDVDMYLNASKKEAELRGKDVQNYNDPEIRQIMKQILENY
ncbi:hypothetical protein ACSIGC_07395 [Tenacibaculum sp. ZS6-P6]|uniref:hypothetical protein n=1 Tax=Tenacibaculum sp. ZS6-P6 TaxID=3447503 RepID=UPI003F97FBF0